MLLPEGKRFIWPVAQFNAFCPLRQKIYFFVNKVNALKKIDFGFAKKNTFPLSVKDC
jgi:hypothetical protein